MIIENEKLIYDILDKLKDEEPYNNIIKQFHSKILSKISSIDVCILYIAKYNISKIKKKGINQLYRLIFLYN